MGSFPHGEREAERESQISRGAKRERDRERLRELSRAVSRLHLPRPLLLSPGRPAPPPAKSPRKGPGVEGVKMEPDDSDDVATAKLYIGL